MAVFNLVSNGKGMPFSDWRAQIERTYHHRTGRALCLDDNLYIRGCYDCGVSPQEMAEELRHG